MRLLMRSMAIVATTLLTAIAGAQAPTSPGRQQLSVIARRVDSIAESLKVPSGRSVAVIKGRDTLALKGYGFADIENEVPATAQTVYQIASLTKQFTAAAILQLAEQGRISLDDDITRYVPAAPVHGRRVLIRQLLNHTSGIPNYTDVAELARVRQLTMWHDSVLALVAADSLLFEPGTHFYYDNTGYHLLGMLVEKVVGRPYGEALDSILFAPLGLTSTSYCHAATIVKHRARGYTVKQQHPLNADVIEDAFAEGGLCSTVPDLARWTLALMTGKVISSASLKEMTTPVRLPSGRKMTYGFGLEIGNLDGHRMISHAGGIPGFSSYLAYFPDDSLTVAFLTNVSGVPSAIPLNLARAVFDLPLQQGPREPKDLATTSEFRKKLAGVYALTQPNGSKRITQVVDKNATLQFHVDGHPSRRLLYQGDATFAVDGLGPARVTFDIGESQATGFQFDDSGVQPLEAVRIRKADR